MLQDTLNIKVFSASDMGKVRPHNEDRFCIVYGKTTTDANITIELGSDEWVLFAIADGMGGTNAGEVAAEIAINTVRSVADDFSKKTGAEPINKQLEKIILNAHQNILSALNEENSGMGTTLVLGLLKKNKIYVAWCGDSRVYKYSYNQIGPTNKYDLPHLQLLTHDHSLVWDMVKKGKLDVSAARSHELSNVITQSLGDISRNPSPESAIFNISPGDKILICSDGLNSMLPDEYIQELLSHEESIEAVGNSLIDAANIAGGHDNISIILGEIIDTPVEAINPSFKERPEAITKKTNASNITERKPHSERFRLKGPVLLSILLVGILLSYYIILSGRARKPSTRNIEEQRKDSVGILQNDTLQKQSREDTLGSPLLKDSILQQQTDSAE